MKRQIIQMRNGIKRPEQFYESPVTKCAVCGIEGKHINCNGHKVCIECLNKYATRTIY